MSKYTVFISHSSDDAEIAGDLKRHIKKRAVSKRTRRKRVDVRVFVASLSIKSGEKWPSRIRQKLKSADELVVIISRSALKSRWVFAELGAAFVLKTQITPACLGRQPLKNLPQFVSLSQSVNIGAESGRKELADQIVKRATRR